jgi:hypothetical protein
MNELVVKTRSLTAVSVSGTAYLEVGGTLENAQPWPRTRARAGFAANASAG